MSSPRRNVALLSACQAVFVTGASLLISVSALVGLALAPDRRLATLPLGLQALVAMLTTMPASLLMKRIGRRNAFALGVLCGGIGAALCSTAILRSSFPLFCSGSAMLGLLGATVTLTTTTAGTVHEAVGWRAMNVAVLPAIGALLLLITWLGRRDGARRTGPGTSPDNGPTPGWAA